MLSYNPSHKLTTKPIISWWEKLRLGDPRLVPVASIAPSLAWSSLILPAELLSTQKQLMFFFCAVGNMAQMTWINFASVLKRLQIYSNFQGVNEICPLIVGTFLDPEQKMLKTATEFTACWMGFDSMGRFGGKTWRFSVNFCWKWPGGHGHSWGK